MLVFICPMLVCLRVRVYVGRQMFNLTSDRHLTWSAQSARSLFSFSCCCSVARSRFCCSCAGLCPCDRLASGRNRTAAKTRQPSRQVYHLGQLLVVETHSLQLSNWPVRPRWWRLVLAIVQEGRQELWLVSDGQLLLTNMDNML